MRYSLRALFVAVSLVALAVWLPATLWLRYPHGHLEITTNAQSHPWRWAMINGKIIVERRTGENRVVCNSPFPLGRMVTTAEQDYVLLRSIRTIPFGVLGTLPDGSLGMLTLTPADPKQQHVATPYGPALLMVVRGPTETHRRTPGFVISPDDAEYAPLDAFSVSSDGECGINLSVPANAIAGMTGSGIAYLHNLETIKEVQKLPETKLLVEPGGKLLTGRIRNVSDGEWYLSGGVELQNNRYGKTLLPICFRVKSVDGKSVVTTYPK